MDRPESPFTTNQHGIALGSFRVLILPPSDHEGITCERILNQQQIATHICANICDLCNECEQGVGAILLAEEHLGLDANDALLNFFNSQPEWSDLPLLVLSVHKEHNAELLDKWQSVANISIVTSPVRVQSFLTLVQSRLHDRSRQYTVRNLLQSLERNRRDFQQLADAMPNIVFAANAQGEIDYFNERAFEFIGCKEELYGSGWFEAIDLLDRDNARAQWKKSLETGLKYEVEMRLREQETGIHRWHIVRALPVWNENGEALRWFGTCTDIHEQKLSESRLNQALDVASVASMAKSEFIANMSHEIRTPMTAVLGYADLLALKETDPEKIDYLRTIKRNGTFLLGIINDILDLSKIEAGKFELVQEWIDVRRLAHDVQSLMEVRAAETDLDFRVCFNGPIPERIYCDAKRLRQILINLVGNAIKFTKKGKVQLNVGYQAGKISFEVMDTGIGMTEEQKAQLFRPFQQGDASVNRRFGGAGLGLAISQRLAKMLDGEISVESALGEGSKFICTIATGDVDSTLFLQSFEDVPDDIHESHSDLKLNCRILIVDDRRDIRYLAGHILINAGAFVEFAEDGLQATELVKRSFENGSTADLILMDMQMPKMDGYEATSRLRQLGYSNPIIALTADVMQGDMQRCIASGCDSYISKPIDSSELLKTIHSYVSK